MNSLEFINEEIRKTLETYESFKLDYDLFHREGDKRTYQEAELKLTYLQQIKSELEAWYEVRKDFTLEWNNPNDASGYYCKYFGDLEYNKIKKGMNNNA